jgi:hypothetical protein
VTVVVQWAKAPGIHCYVAGLIPAVTPRYCTKKIEKCSLEHKKKQRKKNIHTVDAGIILRFIIFYSSLLTRQRRDQEIWTRLKNWFYVVWLERPGLGQVPFLALHFLFDCSSNNTLV